MTPRFVPPRVPSELVDRDQWIVWLYDEEKRKIPYQINGEKAASNRPETWTDYDTAYEVLESHEKLAGLGYVFHPDDPFCGVDLDDCLENGKLKPWAEEIVRRFGETYGEVSPSGTGLKFWCRAAIPAARKFPYADGAIEIYSQGRYFTVTGNRWPTATEDIVECQATVDWLLTLAPKPGGEAFRLPPEIKKGTQHNTLVAYACSLWAKNLDPDEVRQLTLAASKRCQEVPPEKNAIAIADWVITHRRRGHSEAVKAKLNGNTPKDYSFESPEPPPPEPEPDEPEEKPIHYIPWPAPLSEAAFHGPIGELCKILMPNTEADPAAILFQALVMCGNVFGRGIHFTAENTPHFCNEFACIVGATAKGRKGSSFGQVRSVLRQADREWDKTRVKSGLTSGEGLIYHVRDEIREMKQQKGQMVELVTDTGEPDKRMLVMEEELSSAFKAMSREGNTLSGVIRQSWDSPMVLAPMTKNNRITASNPHVSIIGHITKDELHRSLKSVENTNGCTNRFLWCCAKRSNILPFGGNPAGERLAAVSNAIDVACGWAQTVRHEMPFDSDAAEMWAVVYEKLGDIPSGTVGAILSRAEPHVRRVAMIYAVMDRSTVIRIEHLEAAMEIWRYSTDSVRWIFDSAEVATVQDKVQDKILKTIQEHPDGINRRVIAQSVGGGIKNHDLEFHIAALLNLGKIRRETEQRTRQKCEFYYLSATSC